MTDKVQVEIMALECLTKVKLTLTKRAGNISKLGKAFKIADKKGNDRLDLPEFSQLMQNSGCGLSKSEVQALFK